MSYAAPLTSWPTLPQPRDLPALQHQLSARDPRIAAAVGLAERLHAGQLREGSDTPALFHPLSVAALGLQLGLDEVDDLVTAVLLDSGEGGDLTADQLARDFGSRVATQVELLTHLAQAGERTFERLRAAPSAVRLIAGIARFHDLLTIAEARRAQCVQATHERILPLLGDTAAERRLRRLLLQLMALREAGEQKLTLSRDSADGKWVEQALARRIPLDFEQLYRRATLRHFDRRADKEGQLLFLVAYLVTAEDGTIALFERSTLRGPGSVTGRGLLAAVRPMPNWPTEISAFRRLVCPPDTIREIHPVGQGFADVEGARYVFELFNVVLRRAADVTLLSATDRCVGFVDLADAEAALGAGRELDRDLVHHLRGASGPLPFFTPVPLRTRIRERLFLGMDIVAFSTLDTYTQVAELLRFHEHLRSEVRRFAWREPLVFSPTGDGCFLSADPADLDGVLALVGYLRHRIEQENAELGRELRLRFGLNRGPAFSIQDINGSENLIGDGINMAARMLGGKAPWELNVSAGTLGMDTTPPLLAESFRFEAAQLTIKHSPQPVDVLRAITPALSPVPAVERATAECECLRLSDWPHHEDYRSTPLGTDRRGGRYAEVSLERCTHCDRTWLRYFFEEEGVSGSGRWYRGLVTPTQAAEATAASALQLLTVLPFHQYGGSYYGRCGTCEGPLVLSG